MPALDVGAMVRVGPFVIPSRATLASDFWEVALGLTPPLPLLIVGAGRYPGAGTSLIAQSGSRVPPPSRSCPATK